MTDDLTQLASVYLDGQATAAERAQVESDDELLAEVERLRRVRAVLRDPTGSGPQDAHAAPISTRERHLAAALDAWDRLPASELLGGDATPPGSDQAGAAGGASITAPLSRRSKRPARGPISTRILTAAAAVIVLGGAGLVVSGALQGTDSDSSADEAGATADTAASEELSLDVLAAEEFATEGDGEAADELADDAAPPAAVDADDTGGGGFDQAPTERELEVLGGEADLARFANDLIIARAAQSGAATAAEQPAESSVADQAPADAELPAQTVAPTLPPPVDLCGLIDDVVGFAFWEASGPAADPIVVGIDNTTREAVAYQDQTCTEIARTPLP